MTLPLYIVCAYGPCGNVVPVAKPSLQKRRKYCSQRCNGLANANCTKNRAACARGGTETAHRKRLAVLQRVKGLSALEAFRQGYRLGLQRGYRTKLERHVQARRKPVAA